MKLIELSVKLDEDQLVGKANQSKIRHYYEDVEKEFEDINPESGSLDAILVRGLIDSSAESDVEVSPKIKQYLLDINRAKNADIDYFKSTYEPRIEEINNGVSSLKGKIETVRSTQPTSKKTIEERFGKIFRRLEKYINQQENRKSVLTIEYEKDIAGIGLSEKEEGGIRKLNELVTEAKEKIIGQLEESSDSPIDSSKIYADIYENSPELAELDEDAKNIDSINANYKKAVEPFDTQLKKYRSEKKSQKEEVQRQLRVLYESTSRLLEQYSSQVVSSDRQIVKLKNNYQGSLKDAERRGIDLEKDLYERFLTFFLNTKATKAIAVYRSSHQTNLGTKGKSAE